MTPFMYYNRAAVSAPKIQSYFHSVRQADPSLPIGAAGFCWGGKHTIDLASGTEVNGKPLIDAGFTAHPSNVVVPADIKRIKKPVSIAIGDKDMVMSMAQVKQTQDVLKGMENVKSEVVVYPGAGHGFSVRAELGNEKLLEQAAKAEAQAIDWFTQCFS